MRSLANDWKIKQRGRKKKKDDKTAERVCCQCKPDGACTGKGRAPCECKEMERQCTNCIATNCRNGQAANPKKTVEDEKIKTMSATIAQLEYALGQ